MARTLGSNSTSESKAAPRASIGRIVVVAFTCLVVTACTTVTPYKPADGGRYGYSEQRIEDNKYRIVFSGNTRTDLSTVEHYILLRAAEITLANGGGHFITQDASTDVDRTFQSNGTVLGGGGFGRPGFFYGGFGGGGFGNTFNTTRERQAYTIGTIIEFYPGPKPAGIPTAYNAQSVVNNIGPSVLLPE